VSAAEHLLDAIVEGCTRDDHDHIADHRAEVLAEAASIAATFLERFPDWDAMKAAGIIGPHTMARAIGDELRRMADAGQAGKDTRKCESTQPAPHEDMSLPPELREALRIMAKRGPVIELTAPTAQLAGAVLDDVTDGGDAR
jgi:hypothetical protein